MTGEPILIGACVAGIGYAAIWFARTLLTVRDDVREMHGAMFNEHTGVMTRLERHAGRLDRHSDAIRALGGEL